MKKAFFYELSRIHAFLLRKLLYRPDISHQTVLWSSQITLLALVYKILFRRWHVQVLEGSKHTLFDFVV